MYRPKVVLTNASWCAAQLISNDTWLSHMVVTHGCGHTWLWLPTVCPTNVYLWLPMFAVKSNDMMMVIYLASLTRSILALHKLIDNKVSYNYSQPLICLCTLFLAWSCKQTGIVVAMHQSLQSKSKHRINIQGPHSWTRYQIGTRDEGLGSVKEQRTRFS
jgi:hypothetical protein